MNIFQGSYKERLESWYNLRQELQQSSTQDICVAVDAWWQRAPLVNHYLHPDFIGDWPNPWELISENTYCQYARGLGMIYTLSLLGIKDIDFVEAKDDNSEEVVLVLVDSAKYLLNYWPDTVLNNNLKQFSITNYIDIKPIIRKIG